VSARLSSGLSLSNEWVQYEDEEHPNHPLEQEASPAKQRKPVPQAHGADAVDVADAAGKPGGGAAATAGVVVKGGASHPKPHVVAFAAAAVVKVGRGQTVDDQGVIAPTGNLAAAKTPALEGDADADADADAVLPQNFPRPG